MMTTQLQPDSQTILAIRLESDSATARLAQVSRHTVSLSNYKLQSKDMRSASGIIEKCRIFEVIVSFANQTKSEFGVQPSIVTVTCPGIIDASCQTIIKSSRLSILEPLNCGEILLRDHGIKLCLFNDAISMAQAELHHIGRGQMPEDAVFILVGQGVGSAIFIGGKLYIGAGLGGHIGRIVVNPAGPMSRRFNQRGTLETYTTHESIAERLIGENKDDFEKTPTPEYRAKPYYRFRQILNTARRPLDVGIQELAVALEQGDPLVREAVKEAAEFLGQTISYVITLLNPPLIIVGGELMDILPFYFNETFICAKRYSSRLLWEKTKLLRASLGHDAQFIGAAQLATAFLESDDKTKRSSANHVIKL
jgi:glucokinase